MDKKSMKKKASEYRYTMWWMLQLKSIDLILNSKGWQIKKNIALGYLGVTYPMFGKSTTV